jgi:hypothetical protein
VGALDIGAVRSPTCTGNVRGVEIHADACRYDAYRITGAEGAGGHDAEETE